MASKSSQGQRRGMTRSLSTGIPELDMAQQKTSSSPVAFSVSGSIAVPGALKSGGRGRRRSPRGGSPNSSSGSEKSSPNRRSPITNPSYYAGAKFSEAPSPASLPTPPAHWTLSTTPMRCSMEVDQCQDPIILLKNLLKIEA